MFLELDEQGEVQLKRGAMNIPSVRELYSTDKRNESKPFFNKCITVIYHLYKREHDFSNLGPKERERKVASIYLKDEDIKKILENSKVQKVIEDYTTLEYTSVQRLYEGVKNSLEHWKDYMAKIPLTKKVKYEGEHEIISEIDGVPKGTRIFVKTMLEVDNSEEYLKAMKRADEMIDMEEKMSKKVIRESQMLKANGEESMMDSGEFDYMLNKKKI